MAADVGQASACAGLQSRWRDSYERCGRRAKVPPQAEACPTWTGGPTLARKCEVIPAPALCAPNLSSAQAVVLLVGVWMWLVGGNVVLTLIRFPRWIRRTLGTHHN